MVAWFFAGVFFTVLAHTSLYAFFSLYLDSLGYGQTAVGLLWATGIVVEVVWFWFQGGWASRFSMHSWLIVAAVASAAALRGGRRVRLDPDCCSCCRRAFTR